MCKGVVLDRVRVMEAANPLKDYVSNVVRGLVHDAVRLLLLRAYTINGVLTAGQQSSHKVHTQSTLRACRVGVAFGCE